VKRAAGAEHKISIISTQVLNTTATRQRTSPKRFGVSQSVVQRVMELSRAP
jgi:hypothetical protein